MDAATEAGEVPEVSREELIGALRRGRVTLVDVLPRESFAARHIPGALSLPVADIPTRAAQVLPNRDAPIVVYCGGPTWPLGARAVRLLHELGYTDVSHYAGGLTEWFESGASQALDAPAESVEAAPPVYRPTPYRRSLSTRFIDALGDQSVGGLFGMWVGVVVLSGVAYWLLGFTAGPALLSSTGPIGTGARGLLSALYFSSVTATSVGFGDIVPHGVARLIAIVEAVAGLVIFGCVVSKFVSRRQEELIGEIHHIAFEERLGRVRTNLLLVRAELQATARLCEGSEMTPPEALSRVESAAMVFVGELHAVHDLLYRPHSTPDEAVLEAILAGLASVFREFIELLACAQLQRGSRTPALSSSIRTMGRLANEICGDCVPREFAPSLRSWMDQIQRMASVVETT